MEDQGFYCYNCGRNMLDIFEANEDGEVTFGYDTPAGILCPICYKQKKETEPETCEEA